MVRVLTSALALLVLPSIATADIHRCEINGRITYQDQPCPGFAPDDSRVNVPPIRTIDVTGAQTAPAAPPASDARPVGTLPQAPADRRADLQDRMRRLDRDIRVSQNNLDQEMAALRTRKDPVTGLPNPPSELEEQALRNRYQSRIQSAQGQLDSLQAELARLPAENN